VTCGPGRIITVFSLIIASTSSRKAVIYPKSDRLITEKVMQSCDEDGKIHHGTVNRKTSYEKKSLYISFPKTKVKTCKGGTLHT
jgi:hypothetical protein